MEGGDIENIVTPSCVLEYNRGLGGVDKQDQILSCSL